MPLSVTQEDFLVKCRSVAFHKNANVKSYKTFRQTKDKNELNCGSVRDDQIRHTHGGPNYNCESARLRVWSVQFEKFV